MSEQVFLIMLSLAASPLHGYAIMTEIERLSEGRTRLGTGTLYGALKRLLQEGLVERMEELNAPRDRVSYRLTALGRNSIQAEVNRIAQLAALSRKMGFKGAK
ncbi:MAG: PadR family transcriptional regulator [Bryobacteraceae bacterium]